MKRGFTIIEVLAALMVLSILLIPVFNVCRVGLEIDIRANTQDLEYEIASSVCEMFRSSSVNELDKQGVIFLNSIDELGTSFHNTLLCTSTLEYTNTPSLILMNYGMKKYAVIISTSLWGELDFVFVKVIAMKAPYTEVSLKVGR